MKKILPWIKSNLISVIALALAIIAIPVAWFFSTGMTQSTLENIQSDISSVERDLARLDGTYTIPNPRPGEDDITISSPPHPELTDRVAAELQQVVEQARQIRDFVVQRNAGSKDLLVPALFPEPASASGPQGRIALSGKMIDTWPLAHESLLEDANAGSPPDPEDLRRELVAQRDRLLQQAQRASAQGTVTDDDRQRIADELRDIRLDAYRAAAADITFYADTDAFQTMRNYSEDMGLPTVDEYQELFWRWQHTFWVEADIVKGLALANAGGSVLNGPVKRLLSLAVDPLTFEPVQTGSLTANIAPDYNASYTGRTGNNPLYDVRYADIELIVDAGQISRVVNGLAQQNFITAVDWDYQLLAPGAGLTEGYDFGDAQPAKLYLRLETVWIRSWYQDWIPPDVRQQMGLPELQTETDEDAA